MKRTLIPLLLALTLLLTACGAKAPEAPEETADALLGSFVTRDLEGNIVDEEILQGKKLTMINVWATFCGPCLMEMPELEALSQEMADRGVQVVGIVADGVDLNYNELPDTLAQARAIAEQTGVTYPTLIPCRDLAPISGVQAFPTTYLVDEQGRQVGEVLLGARDLAHWRTIVEEALEALS